MFRTRTLGRYIGTRFLMAILAVFLLCSVLIYLIDFVELLRQSQVAAGSTRRPFDFYITAAILYLLITWISTYLFQRAETYSMRGVRRAS